MQPVASLMTPLAVSMGLAAAVIWSASHWRYFLLGCLVVITPLPIVLRGLQKRFDPFEPITIISFAAFVLFALRPVAQLAYGETIYSGLSIEAGFDRALLIALLGVAALYAGYGVTAGRRMASRLKPLPATLEPQGIIAFATGLVIIGLVLYGLYIRQIGGLAVAKSLARGRDPLEGLIVSNTSAYLRFGPFLAIPATLLLLEAAAARRRALFVVLTAVGAGLMVVILAGPRGDRLWLMLLLMSVLVLPYLRTQRRPRMRTIVVAGVLGFAFGITFLSQIRVPVARNASPIVLLERTVENPFRGWHTFILGGDTEMFPILALEAERVPAVHPYNHGVTIISLVTNWIPRAIYPRKTFSADEQVYSFLFPARAKITLAGTAPSIVGGFYYDSGLVGVMLGMFVFGLGARVLFEYLKAHLANAGVRLFYAATLPFIAVTMRGNPTDTVGRMAYIVFPVLVALWWTGRRSARTRLGAA